MGEMRNLYKIVVGKPEDKNHSEDLGVDGRIVFKINLREMGLKGVGQIYLAQVRDWWRALVNTVVNLQVP
jgi:hypothetical protein